MPDNYIVDPIIPNTLVASLKEAFSVQASTVIEITGAKAILAAAVSGISVAAVLGIRSSELAGTLALCFQKATFLGIVNRMLGEKYVEIDADNSDAAGELLNILYASARVKINEAGNNFLPSLPTVVRGDKIEISHGTVPKIVKIDCHCEFGDFHLEVSLKKI